MIQPFHLAIPVVDIEEARSFYRDSLGCVEGRSDLHWVDFNFFGHQLVIHLKEEEERKFSNSNNPVDGKEVPIPHFGVVLQWEQFQEFSKQLQDKNIKFIIEPYIRFVGKPGEQITMFFRDPSGNALEFKAFRNMSQLFAK